MASVLIDPFLYPLNVGFFSPDVALQVGVACCVALLPFLSQRRFHSYVGSLRSAQKRSMAGEKSTLLYIAIAGAFLAGLSKVLLATQLPLVPALFFTLLLVGFAVQAGRRMLRDFESERQRFKNDPFAQVKSWEDQLVTLQLAPMVLARSISIIGAVQVWPGAVDSGAERLLSLVVLQNGLPYSILSLVCLALLMPQRNLYRAFCPKCKQPVPLVMTSLGSCLRCDPSLAKEFTQKVIVAKR